jgi:WD40 repeat protein
MFHMLQTSNDMGHKSSVYSMAVLNDNQGIFATGSGDKTIKVWDFRT